MLREQAVELLFVFEIESDDARTIEAKGRCRSDADNAPVGPFAEIVVACSRRLLKHP